MNIPAISSRLREARERCGLSQVQAAELIGRERKSLIAWEDPLKETLPRSTSQSSSRICTTWISTISPERRTTSEERSESLRRLLLRNLLVKRLAVQTLRAKSFAQLQNPV